MLRACVIDFKGNWDERLHLVEFAYNSFQKSIGMAPYEALYERRCRTPVCWNEVGERKLTRPELVQVTTEAVEIIRKRLKTAQSRQKDYADRRRRPLEFSVGYHVFLKVSPMKWISRFGMKGKLSPRFVGPFEILEKIGDVAYRLALPPKLGNLHDVFHVSMLKKYQPDPSHILDHEAIKVDEKVRYIEEPMQILDRKEQILKTKKIPLVKVLWRHHDMEEATWESEDQMKEKYPYLIQEGTSSV